MTETQQQEEVGFFQEDNGNNSSMRLMSFVSLLSAIGFGLITLWMDFHQAHDGNGLLLTFGFLVGAFAPKAVQKFAEEKITR